MRYTKSSPVGLGKIEREYLSAILSQIKTTVSASEAADILGMSRTKASKLLVKYASKGWLARISQGIYIPVPLDSNTSDIALEEPFVIAEKLFSPCYIGGWSAAEYWGMTEQIFKSIIVMTQCQQKSYQRVIRDVEYLLHYTRPIFFFGLKAVWQNNVKVLISDPTRTIVDLFNNLVLGGGIRASVDILNAYMQSEDKSINLLVEYLRKLNNGAAYKRLGFVLEKYYPQEKDLILECENNLTMGNAKLDASLSCDKLVKKWRLWVPENWK
jgi:predicted transcriptional regulator of viral defense system